MDQLGVSDIELANKKRREKFLQQMDGLVSCAKLEALIEPRYPKPRKGSRPYPLSVMLRVHCMQRFYNQSDPGMEDSLFRPGQRGELQ